MKKTYKKYIDETRNYFVEKIGQMKLMSKKSIIKKKEKKNDKIVLLAKTKSISIEVLISKALINSNISHDEYVLINDALKEYNDMKREIKNLKT